jgi:UDP-N-acetylmuramoylalanine--D-glutamate ligase
MPRVDALSSWYDDWAGLTVTVWGLGDEGFAVADTLVELGVTVTVLLDAADSDREVILDVLGVTATHTPRDQWLPLTLTAPPDIVLLTPQSGATPEERSALREQSSAVWTPLELASRVADKVGGGPRFVFLGGPRSRQIGDLAHQLLLASGVRSFRAGEGVAPALDAVRLPDGLDVVLVDVSEEELSVWSDSESSARRPHVSVCVDDDEPSDHRLLLELYRDTELACVYRRGGGPTEKAVEDAWVVEGCRAIGVGLDTPGMSDFGRVEDIVCDRAFLDDRADRALELCTTAELEQAGLDSAEHALSAVTAFAIARAYSVAPELIGQELARWGGLSE